MRTAVLVVAVMCLAAPAGCGAETDPGARPGDGRTTEGASQEGTTRLTVVVTSAEGQGGRSWTLTCEPAGGDHPDPARACARLASLEDPFAPVPADQACAEIYGGPEEATVTGTYRGTSVEAEFDRTDGCQIARWDAHVDVLVESGGGAGT